MHAASTASMCIMSNLPKIRNVNASGRGLPVDHCRKRQCDSYFEFFQLLASHWIEGENPPWAPLHHLKCDVNTTLARTRRNEKKQNGKWHGYPKINCARECKKPSCMHGQSAPYMHACTHIHELQHLHEEATTETIDVEENQGRRTYSTPSSSVTPERISAHTATPTKGAQRFIQINQTTENVPR